MMTSAGLLTELIVNSRHIAEQAAYAWAKGRVSPEAHRERLLGRLAQSIPSLETILSVQAAGGISNAEARDVMGHVWARNALGYR